MIKPEQVAAIQGPIQTIRIICFALMTGVILATIIFCLIVDWKTVSTELGVLPLVGLGISMAVLIQAYLLPPMVAKSALAAIKNIEPDLKIRKLLGVFQTKTIVHFALLEGAAFLCGVLFLVTRNIMMLGVVVVCIALMAYAIPKTDLILGWMDDQLESY